MAYIELTKGGSDSRTKGTISCWVKRSNLGTEQYVWGWGEANNSDAYLRFDAGDNIEDTVDAAIAEVDTVISPHFNDTDAEHIREVVAWVRACL